MIEESITIKTQRIAIEISEEQAEIFKFAMENWSCLKRLKASEAFKVKEMQVILDFDSGGNLKNIKKRKDLNYHYN